MRMLLVITGLGSGGAERVLASLANAWSSRGDDITILTWDSFPAFYPIRSSVRRVSVGLAANSSGVLNGVCANRRRIGALRRCLRQLAPDVVVSFMDRTNVLTICATFGLGTPTIVCEHNDPAQLRVGAIWSALRLLIYPMAGAVTFLTANVVRRWRPLLGSKAVPMPNPVVVDEQDGGSDDRLFKHPHNLIAVGRLVPQKGFDLLLEAFRHVAPRYEQWGLTILGEGDLRPNLERMVEKFSLGGRVHLAGRVTNPFAWFRQADLFLMTSRFEGFPCSLCEALACGLPAISFDCDSGPRDIIRHEVDGLLVPPLQVEALAAAMDRLMADPAERARFSARAPEILRRYSIHNILQRWDELFLRVGATDHSVRSEKRQQLRATQT